MKLSELAAAFEDQADLPPDCLARLLTLMLVRHDIDSLADPVRRDNARRQAMARDHQDIEQREAAISELQAAIHGTMPQQLEALASLCRVHVNSLAMYIRQPSKHKSAAQD